MSKTNEIEESILVTEMTVLNNSDNSVDIESNSIEPLRTTSINIEMNQTFHLTNNQKTHRSTPSGVDLFEEGEGVTPLIDLIRADSWLQVTSPPDVHKEDVNLSENMSFQQLGAAIKRRSIFAKAKHDQKDTQGVDKRTDGEKGRLGTIKGVLLPCSQNILGVILFLRLPFITAQAGTILTTFIIVLCVISTLLTTLSMSAIATNGKIQEGGPYYIISRNLGVEIGGAVGLLFYLGTSFASSMYALGAIESFQTSFNFSDQFDFDVQIQALCLMLLMASIVSVGVKYVNMSSQVFFAMVVISIFSSIIGLILVSTNAFQGDIESEDKEPWDNMNANYQEDPDTGLTPTFFTLLALFYPSTTGIMAGSNRSGVLKNPGQSIPYGTLGAIFITTSLYILVVWLFGANLSNEALIEDKLILASVSWPHVMLVNIGIIMSSVGAGLQSLTGAPRLLAAISNDSVIPFLNYFKTKPGEEPTKAIWMTWFIASIPCLAGNLDFITPIVTMFFLLMYGCVNLSCFLLAFMRAPGFRPRWKYFNWITALFGTIWCVGLMLVISWYVAIIAMMLMSLLLLYIKSKGAHKNWGNALEGMKFQWARDSLLALGNSSSEHAKNWRPQLLVLTKLELSGDLKRPELLRIASQMKKGRGLVTVVGVLEGDPLYEQDRAIQATHRLGIHMKSHRMTGFPQVSVSQDIQNALYSAVNHTGIGLLRPNSVLCGWPNNWQETPEKVIPYVNLLKNVLATHKAIMILKDGENIPEESERLENGFIDIWWIVHDSGLLLLIPYLLKLHKVWRKCQLRLYAVTTSVTASPVSMLRNIKRHLNDVRIQATVEIVDLSHSDFETAKVYERTLNIKQRKQILKALDNPTTMSVMIRNPPPKKQKRRSTIAELFPVLISPKKERMSTVLETFEEEDDDGDDDESENEDETEESKKMKEEKMKEKRESEEEKKRHESVEEFKRLRSRSHSLEMIEQIQEIDEQRMIVALNLNKKMREESQHSKLIITNLPLSRRVDPIDFMGYIETMTENLKNILLIRGSGKEVVTTYG